MVKIHQIKNESSRNAQTNYWEFFSLQWLKIHNVQILKLDKIYKKLGYIHLRLHQKLGDVGVLSFDKSFGLVSIDSIGGPFTWFVEIWWSLKLTVESLGASGCKSVSYMR